MILPLQVTAAVRRYKTDVSHTLTLHRGLTVLLGPNGSGKTQLLRGLRKSLQGRIPGKGIRFLSAGRIGLLEQFRSDYDATSYGSKEDAHRQHRIETLTGAFQTLAERADIFIKVQERLRRLFKRDLLLNWDGGMLKVSFCPLEDDAEPYSSGREASGLIHLVGILAALYDDGTGALLLDEPEVSLHPQLQAFLLEEILSVAGDPSEGGNRKIVVIATHSTEMVRIRQSADLLSLVFCSGLGSSPPVQIPADAEELKNTRLRGLIARLGYEHKLALFVQRPLLVEGPTDAIICGALASRLGLHLEAGGSQLLPVVGKGEMPTLAKLLRLLGKNPVALVDADGIADGLDLAHAFISADPGADSRACEKGFSSGHDMAREVFGDFCALVEHEWDHIASFAEKHAYWKTPRREDSQRANRRAAFATLFTAEDAILKGLAPAGKWHSMRSRLAALLDVLEGSGLFVLRKGSIEAYYLSSERRSPVEKPSLAALEADEIAQRATSECELAFADVIRCLRHASFSDVVCEADALRDLLLSVVTPVFARFKEGDSSFDCGVIARGLLAERASLFGFSIEDDALVVSIESGILEVSGFPIRLRREDDVVRVLVAALARRS